MAYKITAKVELNAKEYTLSVRQLDMTAKALRQMPVMRSLSLAQRKKLEPVCWIYGDSIDAKQLMRREPHVLCLLYGTPVLWVPTYVDYDDAKNICLADPAGFGSDESRPPIKVPFALIG